MALHETILVVDFGSQVTQLIARRIREAGVFAVVVPPAEAAARIAAPEVRGIVLSGGPASVYEASAPTVTDEVLATDKPVLGICYGMQITRPPLRRAGRAGAASASSAAPRWSSASAVGALRGRGRARAWSG